MNSFLSRKMYNPMVNKASLNDFEDYINTYDVNDPSIEGHELSMRIYMLNRRYHRLLGEF